MPLAHNEMAEHMLGPRWGPGKVKNGTAALIRRQPRRRWGRGQRETSCSLAVSAGGTGSPLPTPNADRAQPGAGPGAGQAGLGLGGQAGTSPEKTAAAPSGPSPLLTDPWPPSRRHLPGLSRWPSGTPSPSWHQGGLFPTWWVLGTHGGGPPLCPAGA